jgi:hypothetical protein
MGVFVYKAPWISGTSGSLSALLFHACTGGACSRLSLQRWTSCEHLPCRFQKVDSDRQQLVVDCLVVGAEEGRSESKLFHGLCAVVELEHLLDCRHEPWSASLRDLLLLPYHARVPLLLWHPQKGRAFATLVLALKSWRLCCPRDAP